MPKSPREEASPQPHDALFQWTFSQREHGAGLLKAALPPALASAVDFSTLRVEKGSFVDRALRSRHSDLVLSARMRGEPVYFYALIEQQRRVEALMVLRILVYMTRLWEQLVRDRPRMKVLPPIIPILLHHSDTGWTAATAFQDVVAAEESVRSALRPYIPHFELLLVDLSEGQPSRLVDQALTALGQVVLGLLSVAGDSARLERELGRVAAAVREIVEAPDALAALEALVRYLLATHPGLSVKKVTRLLEKAGGPQTTEAMMTVLDEIELRGERRGKREGRAKMLLQQMEVRFGPVSADVATRIEAADETALGRWAIRVLTAPTPEEVIGDAADDTGQPRRAARKTTARKPPQRAKRTA